MLLVLCEFDSSPPSSSTNELGIRLKGEETEVVSSELRSIGARDGAMKVYTSETKYKLTVPWTPKT